MTAGGTALAEASAVVGTVPVTLEEAGRLLHPPMNAEALRRIVMWLPGLRPVGKQPTGGRPADVYSLAEIMELHNVLRRWL